jgi:hypothetical protein
MEVNKEYCDMPGMGFVSSGRAKPLRPVRCSRLVHAFTGRKNERSVR